MNSEKYNFALVLNGIKENDNDYDDKLYGSGCDDAVISYWNQLVYVDFCREAPSLKDAIFSAINDVKNSGVNAQIERIEDTTVLNQSQLGEKLKKSRQAINQMVSNKSSSDPFPSPLNEREKGAKVWEWSIVSAWLARQGRLSNEAAMDAQLVTMINTTLKREFQRAQNPALSKEIDKTITQLRKRRPSPPVIKGRKFRRVGTNSTKT